MNKRRIHPRLSTDNSEKRKTSAIEIFGSKGVRMVSPKGPGNPTGKGGGKRGKIKGWSTASRRRMRSFMMTHRPIEGYNLYVGTFTIPGPIVPFKTAQDAFKNWCLLSCKKGIGCVWRIEIQKRGQLHWHLLLAIPAGMLPETVRELWIDEIAKLGWVGVWYDPEVHDRLIAGAREGEQFEFESRTVQIGEVQPGVFVEQPSFNDKKAGKTGTALFLASRWMLPGVESHCVRIDPQSPNDGKTLYYLQDHASKHKQEQVAEGVGRHWGVSGRKCFEQVLPDTVTHLTWDDYKKVLRWLQRWHTPRVKDDRCFGGRRLGWKIRRGSRGSSDWFTDPQVVQRMIDFVSVSSAE